jgi:hypothetical protein
LHRLVSRHSLLVIVAAAVEEVNPPVSGIINLIGKELEWQADQAPE